MRRTLIGLSCLLAASAFAASSYSSEPRQPDAAGLVYDAHTRGPVPIPPAEQTLQTVNATPWFKVADQGLILEGAIFDAHGNLLFCDVTGRRVLRLSPDRKLSTLITLEGLRPGGLALHKDGRLFIAAIDLDAGRGAIFALSPDGSDVKNIIAPEAGYLPNDLVFDSKGGFYFTDFKGTATEPKGGVYYVTPDFATIRPVLPNLSMANGLALSPDGKTLWASEFGRNLLHRVELTDPTTIAPIGSAIPYRFTGPAPDSMRVDSDGNVYVAIYGQGRSMVFNRNGIPIGQILLPGRDNGRNLHSTSLAIRPGTHDLYAVSSDGPEGRQAAIFHARVFGLGLMPKVGQQ
ncbi:SMP-30/gluconolactonase/LRE family protein [Dickeya dianthicola]|uniref:SMP-30/gluconolactonase/LRE family protein n=1 Tax=Dickeya dianthicola TaxID=204039 RepID=UPI001865BDF5|nr:SMP-30/gluconolactonase/LRE family protein [Dickeya dianthicola]QOL14206.1 SMP-30/gluconolactonase/LRE family protein [Dickeya dianthicola]